MAYQNVGTPRFFINVFEWLASNGVISNLESMFRTLPVDVKTRSGGLSQVYPVPSGVLGGKSFTAILGHNLPIANIVDGWGVWGSPSEADDIVSITPGTGDDTIEVNVSSSGAPEFNGFSILDQSFEGETHAGIYFNGGADVGSVIVGSYYQMPHSPDLNLTMTREYGGIKTIETKGGASLSNAFYSKPPKWGGLGAWELEVGLPQHLAKSGRRIWDLSFSYLSDSSIFPETSSLTRAGEAGYSLNYDTHLYNTLLTDDNFYSQVIHKTNGGQLPFIFQPDAPRLNASTGLYEGGNNNPDQFAICKFDSGFKFEQVANSVYNVKLKIREVW